MARATSARRTGRPVQLRPGMSTVESAKVVELADGRYRMQWYVCLPTGKVVHKKIERRARRKADIRDRARELTDELLRTGGEWGLAGWKGSSDMGRFVEKVCVKAVEENRFSRPLRPTTQERYVHDLRLFAERAHGVTIAAASRPKFLVPAFQEMAREHGTATARKAATTCSKYVFRRLVTYQVVDHDPLVGIDLELPVAHGGRARARRRVARCVGARGRDPAGTVRRPRHQGPLGARARRDARPGDVRAASQRVPVAREARRRGARRPGVPHGARGGLQDAQVEDRPHDRREGRRGPQKASGRQSGV